MPHLYDKTLSHNPQTPAIRLQRLLKVFHWWIELRETINEALTQEARFPELESYVTQGISGEYDVPSTPAWMPYQKVKQYDLPPQLLEQVSYSGLGMLMGIFAPFGHGWMALDSSLYLWDYTLPNPEIIGWEQNTNPIMAIKLVTPKPGVFVREIEHLIVVVTSVEMILLGVAIQQTSTGAKNVSMYDTQMKIPIKGLGVNFVEASKRTGRIFFVGSLSDDIYEFQYQQDEGWFRGRTARKCHTQNQFAFVGNHMKAIGGFFGPQGSRRLIRQLTIDDSRNILYTLSTTNDITAWTLQNDLHHALSRPLSSLLQNTGHFSPRTELLEGNVSFQSLSVISANEASRLSLMATTNTGCRLYISVTRGYGYPADDRNAPTSMQILHIRFPPRDPNAAPPTTTTPQQPGQTAVTPYGNPANQVDSKSRVLTVTDAGYRFPPGYFMAFLENKDKPNHQKVFCSAIDSARLKNLQDTSPLNQRFAEFGMFLELPGSLQDVTSIHWSSLCCRWSSRIRE